MLLLRFNLGLLDGLPCSRFCCWDWAEEILPWVKLFDRASRNCATMEELELSDSMLSASVMLPPAEKETKNQFKLGYKLHYYTNKLEKQIHFFLNDSTVFFCKSWKKYTTCDHVDVTPHSCHATSLDDRVWTCNLSFHRVHVLIIASTKKKEK